MKKTIRDYNLDGKKVIIRCDFNVPIKNSKILDDNRIKESLETINYAIDNNAKVILLSHLGRIKTEEDLSKNTLEPVSKSLSKLLNKKVLFINKTRGKEVEEAINKMQSGDIVLLENTRYEDLDDKKESTNDNELGKYWASLGDIFINDAFGTSHREHASNVGIASHLPNGIGFLIEKEIKNMEEIIKNPDRPFMVILGGAKVHDKIGVIEKLAEKCDNILIGGAMAHTFLVASGMKVGKSYVDTESIEFCKKILKKYEDKIILPIDIVCTDENNKKKEEKFLSDLDSNDIGVDIGSKTLKIFKQYLNEAKTIVWNGPVGMFEIDKFSDGTKKLCEILKSIKAKKIVGGGDTASAVINFGYKQYFTHISTGGGASLEMLEGKKLPAIEIIDEK